MIDHIDHLSAWIIACGAVFAGAILAYAIGHARGRHDVIDEILTFIRENVK